MNARGSVERVEGVHEDYPHRRWVTHRVYLDGVFLGNAVDEDEGWRWIADMIKMERRERCNACGVEWPDDNHRCALASPMEMAQYRSRR